MSQLIYSPVVSISPVIGSRYVCFKMTSFRGSHEMIYCCMSKRSLRKFERDECQQRGCHRKGITFCDDCVKLLCFEHAIHWTGMFKKYTYCRQCFSEQTLIRVRP